uniref:Uncharacterized protein n=1 Tax=Sphingobacterium sp. (strain 21) TaxID=743722 RepID=F4C8S3_SPHS2
MLTCSTSIPLTEVEENIEKQGDTAVSYHFYFDRLNLRFLSTRDVKLQL